MPFLTDFSTTFFAYARELFFPILIGFFISGIIHEFIPTKIVEKYLGQKGLKPIFASSLIGTLLPICCFGTLPVAITMQQKGARLGPVLAFLITTPATSVSALMACWKLLGPMFTIYIFFAVIIMGLVMGMAGNLVTIVPKEISRENKSCCQNDGHGHPLKKDLTARIESALRYAFIDLPKEIGFEILIGIAVASLIIVFMPLQHFVRQYLSGTFGYVFSLVAGLLTYVCSTASVPMADALMKSGMAQGAAMVYLLAGPVTSYGVILAVRKEFGAKVLGLYLGVICAASLFFGYLFNFITQLF